MEEQLGTSPPLELRRTVTGQRVAVPHSLQSPQDRATGKLNCERNISEVRFDKITKVPTDSPQVAQVYVPGTRIPHPHYPDARYYESARVAIPTPEPPPAHRNPLSATPPTGYVAANELPSHLHSKAMEREREQREKERKSSIPGMAGSTELYFLIKFHSITYQNNIFYFSAFKYTMPK